jgi:hypothetical protein
MPFSATVDLGSGINTVSCQKHAIGLFGVKYPTTAPGMFLINNFIYAYDNRDVYI